MVLDYIHCCCSDIEGLSYSLSLPFCSSQDVPLSLLVLDVEFQFPLLPYVRDWSGILAAIMEPVY